MQDLLRKEGPTKGRQEERVEEKAQSREEAPGKRVERKERKGEIRSPKE